MTRIEGTGGAHHHHHHHIKGDPKDYDHKPKPQDPHKLAKDLFSEITNIAKPGEHISKEECKKILDKLIALERLYHSRKIKT